MSGHNLLGAKEEVTPRSDSLCGKCLGQMAERRLFEIYIHGKTYDLAYTLGAPLIMFSMGLVIWAALAMPME